MIVTYLGHECFKIQYGDLTIAINPPAKSSKFKSSKFGADVVLQTIEHEDMGGGEDMSFGDKTPYIISGPGEYETNGIFVHGVGGTSTYDPKTINKDNGQEGKRVNSIYSLSVDGINMLFLGAQSGPLPSTLSDAVDVVDLLFIPIGGDGVYDAKEAYKIAMNLEAKMIVPMHFKDEKDDVLKQFLKEAGATVSSVDKLTIKRKDIENKEGEIVVLAPQV
jgi:L-ascorbate metabolism protein UlaG (beta-lactamase superfamily)